MRILALTPYPAWPPDHGGKIRNFHLLKSLAEHHEVVNVTGLGSTDAAHDEAGLEAVGIAVRSAPLRMGSSKLSATRRLRKYIDLACGRSSLFARFQGPELGQLIRSALSEPWDAVWIDQIWMAPYLPPDLPAPLIHASHNVESLLLERRASSLQSSLARYLTRLEARRLATAEGHLLRRAALTVATSDDDAAAFEKLAPDATIEVIANGVDLASHARLGPPSFDPLRLMFVGGCDYPPNLDAARRLAVEVLPLLQDGDQDTEVHLVGRDPNRALADLEGRPGVHLHGHATDLMGLYEKMSALLVPMAFGGGSRLKILESWALGRPVVATAAGASGLDAEPGVHYLEAETPAATAAAVRSLRSDPNTVQSLITQGRNKAEACHDWQALGAHFCSLLEEAVESSKPGSIAR